MVKLRLAAIRVNMGLTQEEFAEKMGVSRTTVLEWENDKREMRLPYLKLLCELSGLNEDDIIMPINNT